MSDYPHPIPRTLFDKVWQRHAVRTTSDGHTLLYIDQHLVNEVTSPQAFDGLRLNGLRPWRSASVLATADHNVPTANRPLGIKDTMARLQVEALGRNCAEFGLTEFPMHDARQGILHVVGPEQGATLPGTTIVCGDSHTTTHGAFAALAFGIGTSEIEHVLATQCLTVKKPATMQVRIEGRTRPGVTSKDLALALIGQIGTSGGTGHALEFAGSAIAHMSMEARMTLCNMAIEAGARCATGPTHPRSAAGIKRCSTGVPCTPTREPCSTAPWNWMQRRFGRK
jgi:3-isopropylmalate/(R)-2-methylmalate dehydratase large subunit